MNPGERHELPAPLKDMLFDIEHLANLPQIAQLPGFEEAGLETARRCWRSAPSSTRGGGAAERRGRPQSFQLEGRQGHHHARLRGGLPPVRRRRWQGLQHPGDFGGQGLPKTIGAACIEMLNSANLSFALCPLLTDGAIEALLTAGSTN